MKSFEAVWADRRLTIERIAHKISRGFGGTPTLRTLIGAGQVALWHVWLTFKSRDQGGCLFWTFAYPRIVGAMLDELRQLSPMGRSAYERVKNDDLESVPWACLFPAPLKAAEHVSTVETPESELLDVERTERLRLCIQRLPERLQLVLKQTVFLHIQERIVAKRLGVSESRVSQLRSEAIALLKGLYMVQCEVCQSTRLDGPENCPKCGGYLKPVVTIPSQPESDRQDEIVEDGNSDTQQCDGLVDAVIREGIHADTLGSKVRADRVLIRYKGETLNAPQWAKHTGLNINTINYRIAAGYTPEQIFNPETFRNSKKTVHQLSKLTLRKSLSISTTSDQPSFFHTKTEDGVTYDYIDGNTVASGQLRRYNVRLTFDGRTQTITEWANELHVPVTVLRNRVSLGWSAERVLTQKKRDANSIAK
jgi:RNA polymerase sigma factor (sigma-70 family)